MYVGIEFKQARPAFDEATQLGGIGEVQTARERRQDQPQAKNVAQRIVVTNLLLPAHITREIDGLFQVFAALADAEVVMGAAPGRHFHRVAQFSHNVECSDGGFFQSLNLTCLQFRSRNARRVENNSDAVHLQ